MGTRIVKQPDGQWALFSTIPDDFIAIDLTPEDMIEILLERERKDIERRVYQTVEYASTPAARRDPRLNHSQSYMTWREAVRDYRGKYPKRRLLEYIRREIEEAEREEASAGSGDDTEASQSDPQQL